VSASFRVLLPRGNSCSRAQLRLLSGLLSRGGFGGGALQYRAHRRAPVALTATVLGDRLRLGSSGIDPLIRPLGRSRRALVAWMRKARVIAPLRGA